MLNLANYFMQHLFSILEVAVIAISIVVLRRQIRETHEWNRRKTTQEILYSVADGQTHQLMQKIRWDFGCDVAKYPPPRYDAVLETFPDDKKREFQSCLIQVINRLEVIAIAIRHDIVDEEIAYDYLGRLLPAYYFFTADLIQSRRTDIKFQRGAASLEHFAREWDKRAKLESEKLEQEQQRLQEELHSKILIPPKPKLESVKRKKQVKVRTASGR